MTLPPLPLHAAVLRPSCTALVLALLMLLVAQAAGVGPGSSGALGAGVPPPGGGQGGQPPPAPGNATAHPAAAATAAPRPAVVKDLGFGLGGYGGRGGFDESALAAVFNKVAKGTTATPISTRPAATTTTAAPTTTRPPPTTTRPSTAAPPPTEVIPVRLPPPPPPMETGGGPPPTRRAPHPEYPLPNRPPPLPAEYNPFANKAILRGSQSEVGSAGPIRKPHPQVVPRPPMDGLIPLRPVGGKGGPDSPAGAAVAEVPRPERPERPPERAGAAGKHHLDQHIHTVPPAPAPAPALAPHHQAPGHGTGHGAGHHGHGHGHGAEHALKAAKPTELLEQVNKDSIIDVQLGVAVVADPAIHRDESSRDKVIVVPATSPPSSAVNGPGGGLSPVAGAAGGEWHLAWTAQVFGLGTMWGVLAVLCLVAAVCVDSRTRLVPRVHFSMLLALLLALAAANCVSLFYDALNQQQLHTHRPQAEEGVPAAAASSASSPSGLETTSPATRVPQLLADLTLPFLPAAFSVFFVVVLRMNHIPCGSSGVPQTPAFLVLLFLFLATTMSLEVASCAVAGGGGGDGDGQTRSSAGSGAGVAGGCGAGGMRSAARGLTVAVTALLAFSYMVVYRPLRRAAAKKQAEQLRAAYTAFRRLPTPALPRVVNALLASAVLLVSLAAQATYRLMDATLIGSDADWHLPPWWYLRLSEHVGSLLVGFLLLWCATRGPSRGSDERSTASRSTRGTPGALSLVSCTGRRFLFDCPSTGSEENKTSEDTYPAVCASNHAILNYTQHSGNKLYDDSFPLANLHSAPLNSSGDDFSHVPTMPKRASRASSNGSAPGVPMLGNGGGGVAGVPKCGTLGPYAKGSRRAPAPGAAPGHHTLGPGGKLHEAGDTLRRGSRTTGRTRRPRHNRGHHEVYSNCPQQDDEYDYDRRIDSMADEFTVFKQYASTGSSESADNYDVPMLVSAAPEARDGNNKRHRRRDRGGQNGTADRAEHLGGQHHRGRPNGRQAGGAGPNPADSLSPASPSDLSDCDRLSSNRSSYDEGGGPAAVRGHGGGHVGGGHHSNHHHHRSKKHQHLYDASEDDVTPDSAVVADITASSPRAGRHSPREKRAGGGTTGRRLGRRPHQHLSQESPSSPELHDNVWSPQ